jgi:heme/copper-type cytochrome/quinol oxidase subunit 1
MFTVGGLSGVVLANASLDIAFHDRGFILFISLSPLILISFLLYSNMHKTKSISILAPRATKINMDEEYIKAF